MAQPQTVDKFQSPPIQGRTWRIAHLSDIHVVGERYGFRIECGRSGPRGNERLKQALGAVGYDSRCRSARRDPDHGRHDGCRAFRRVGRIFRRAGAVSSACRTLVGAAGQSRSQRRRSNQSGTLGTADEPEPAAAPASCAVRHVCSAGYSGSGSSTMRRASWAKAWQTRSSRSSRRWQLSPMRDGCSGRSRWRISGIESFR